MPRELHILEPGTGRPYSPGDSLDWTQPQVFTVEDVLAPGECEEMIARIDALGPTAAPITTHRGFVMRPDIRNNRRVMFDDPDLAAELFRRVRHALPDPLHARRPVGVNERLRCYCYDPGERFAPHLDGAFVRDPDEASELTFMVYLNDDFTGGHTVFHSLGIDVAPRPGLALFFQHRHLHEGCVVTAGTKYALRTDVMYRRPT